MTDFNKGVGRYIDLMFDRGFKRVFGKESNKDILIAFLNETIPDRRIEDLQYMNNENEGLPSKEREQYIKDMAIERDIINQNEYARQEGKLEGIAEGRH